MTQLVGQAGRLIVQQGTGGLSTVAQAISGFAASAAVTSAQNLLYGPVKRRSSGPRIEQFRVQTASEGVGIPRVFGRQRIAGEVIWQGQFVETTEVLRSSSGGKSVRRSVETEHTEYLYSVSLAIGLCEGTISRIGRVWADGNEISLHHYDHRWYRGDETQMPDPLLEMSNPDAPAFRGLAYIVFDSLPLAAFGNRIPQFSFEVERDATELDPDGLEAHARAVTLIPGSGEHVYHTDPVHRQTGEGQTRGENTHVKTADTDFIASVDHLEAVLPKAQQVALIVSWFGTDLRAGNCVVEPRVEDQTKVTEPLSWSVGGQSRLEVNEVSRLPDGSPAYGGTPSDEGIRSALRDLSARNKEVMFYPFLLMDIPQGNSLPDFSGAAGQPSYPWRGRISVPDGQDGTAQGRQAVEAFFAHFREMIVHYAQICAEEGGVGAFLIGSELRGLTRVRDEVGAFPAVAALRSLAAEVRTIVGAGVKVGYAADWSEYANYRPEDGSGDVLFPLDDLWADSHIDFVGIDNYMPLSDWRDGTDHADYLSGVATLYDRAYLEAGIEGGEGFDWYYASPEDRDNQVRTPIVDTAHGEDWIFRVKDLRSWWSLPHHERPGGIRAASPTAWVPESKPIWFTELGCSATDKGSNQPNIFFDPKSSESGRPYHSRASRDDIIQRRFLEAHLRYWERPENNPVSSHYAGEMIDTDRIYLYTWDARPFPAFPLDSAVWADATNWTYGHWLNGRAGKIPVGRIIERLAQDSAMPFVNAEACADLVAGYGVSRPMAAREAIEPLLDYYQLDSVETAGVMSVRPRSGRVDATRPAGDLVERGGGPISIERAQSEDLPNALSLTFVDGFSDYDPATLHLTNPAFSLGRTLFVDVALVLEEAEAAARAGALLAEALAMQTRCSFSLSPDDVTLEPSDVLFLTETDQPLTVRIVTIQDGDARDVEAVVTDGGLYSVEVSGGPPNRPTGIVSYGTPVAELLDVPILPDGVDAPVLTLASYADPWPGGVLVLRAQTQFATIAAPSQMGRLTAALPGGVTSRWDYGSHIALDLLAGSLSSAEEEAVLEGTNRALIRSRTGEWEVLGFRTATLLGDGTWELSGLLRGLRGTEEEAMAGADAGARIVFLSGAEETIAVNPDILGTEDVWQAGPATATPGAYPYSAQDFTPQGLTLRPFSPVHGEASATGSHIQASWTRRSRIGGDNWSAETVPLGEASEAYRVRAYSAAAVLLAEWTVTSPTLDADVSGATHLEIAQISASFGPGRALSVPVLPLGA
ncbi:MAG: baseplate multidomain protein megatron [Parvularcula sp.]